ncbi:MAG: hypothetical protein SOZ23_01655 [Methanosphaera sp.]|uniref:class III signal peptide-containing protein n=1 Tax=Methanosphaera sp. TaxID=2666342 RepID=UPI0025EA4B44|nr:hypothetical protein [Methanosphaera sp.]MCI5866573.1 hypothetical protein [Methanosphaera sp.]MDD6535050.1 hypothetical protein [Methanosphaera sp.]MDY3955482.1 hypothetical protein [Methanosphaera sp.]
MKIIKDQKAQISIEVILIVTTVLIIILVVANFTINYYTTIATNTKTILNTTHNSIINKI